MSKLYCKEPNSLPALEELERLLTYNSSTGKFFWRDGKEAFAVKASNGYLRPWFGGKRYYAHRIAWLMGTGRAPRAQLDHIDGNRSNNALSNLREATPAENMKNRRKSKNNQTGFSGVRAERGKWRGEVQVSGRRVRTALFERIETAVVAVEKLKSEHGFHPNHGN